MKNLKHDRTCVYNINYHIVWSVKYRKNVLVGRVADRTREILGNIAREKEFNIESMEVMPDHVHIFASAMPKFSPSYIYKMLKGISGRRLFKEFPELKQNLYKGKLWNPSTYVETIGHICSETVEKYIEDQKSL